MNPSIILVPHAHAVMGHVLSLISTEISTVNALMDILAIVASSLTSVSWMMGCA